MKAILLGITLFGLAVSSIIFAREIQSIHSPVLSLKVDANYANENVTVNWELSNDSKESMHLYLQESYPARNYLRIEKENGNELPNRSLRLYTWEKPIFHDLKPGEKITKVFNGKIMKRKNSSQEDEQYLAFEDVEFKVTNLKQIKIRGKFEIDVNTASRYQHTMTKNRKVPFWIGATLTPPLLLQFE